MKRIEQQLNQFKAELERAMVEAKKLMKSVGRPRVAIPGRLYQIAEDAKRKGGWRLETDLLVSSQQKDWPYFWSAALVFRLDLTPIKRWLELQSDGVGEGQEAVKVEDKTEVDKMLAQIKAPQTAGKLVLYKINDFLIEGIGNRDLIKPPNDLALVRVVLEGDELVFDCAPLLSPILKWDKQDSSYQVKRLTENVRIPVAEFAEEELSGWKNFEWEEKNGDRLFQIRIQVKWSRWS